MSEQLHFTTQEARRIGGEIGIDPLHVAGAPCSPLPHLAHPHSRGAQCPLRERSNADRSGFRFQPATATYRSILRQEVLLS